MHKKRISVGKGKKPKWFVVSKPGPHSKGSSISLLYILRDILQYADNAREARAIINGGLILVNKKPIKEVKYPVGLMDVLEIPKLKKYYRVLPGKKEVRLVEISESESKTKLWKIINKQTHKKGKIQLNLHDGSNIIINKDTFKTKDTLVIEISSGKIKDVLEYKKGNTALVVHGRHSGGTGVISQITEAKEGRKSRVKLGEIETLTDYVFIIGKDKPLISI